MIEINLLPDELKKKKAKKGMKFDLADMALPKISYMPILIGIVGLLVAVYLGLVTISAIKNHTLNKLDKEWKVLLPKKKELDELRAQIKELERKNAIMEELFSSRFIWADKINQLSDTLPEGLWLENLSLTKSRSSTSAGQKRSGKGSQQRMSGTLELKGSAALPEGDEMIAIGKFIKNLKEEQGFIKDFDNIELSSVQTKKVGRIEILDFLIKCYFKEEVTF